jgi:hypothetical protein
MTDGAGERRPHPGTKRGARSVEYVERRGCESSACGADRIRWRLVRWEVAFAEGACGALPHRERESGWDIVTGPTIFLVRRLDGAERLSDTQRDTPRSVALDRRVAIESR